MAARGVRPNAYKTWPGFIPECFKKVPASQTFSYVRLDVDQYVPTKLAAEWAYEKLMVGGILSSHDYFINADRLASLAMKDFVNSYADVITVLGNDEDEIFIRKDA